MSSLTQRPGVILAVLTVLLVFFLPPAGAQHRSSSPRRSYHHATRKHLPRRRSRHKAHRAATHRATVTQKTPASPASSESPDYGGFLVVLMIGFLCLAGAWWCDSLSTPGRPASETKRSPLPEVDTDIADILAQAQRVTSGGPVGGYLELGRQALLESQERQALLIAGRRLEIREEQARREAVVVRAESDLNEAMHQARLRQIQQEAAQRPVLREARDPQRLVSGKTPRL